MMKKIALSIATIMLLLSISMPFVQAAQQPPTPPNLTLSKPPIRPIGTDKEPLALPGVGTDQGQALQESVIPKITNFVIELSGGVALLFVIISGIQILTAYGNEEKLVAAKKTLTFAIAGLVIAILSYAIVQIIISINFK